MSGRGRDTLPDVREWLGVPPGCLGRVTRPSRMSESGRESLPNVREGSGGTLGCLGVVRRPFWMFGSGREALPEVQEALLDVRKWSVGSPGSS